MAKNEQSREANQPIWVDGKSINEALFCDDFLSRHKIIYTNGAFFTPDGRVTDDLPLRSEIFDELRCCAVSNIPRKISNIVELMKLAALLEDFPPEADRIHLANGTLMLDGSFTEGKPEIVRCRLPVAYNPGAPTPARWLAFLDGLLYPEDIPTLQEYIGYCLIPSNKGQRMMVIKGSGGEGKSQIGAVLSALFGSNMKDGSMFRGLRNFLDDEFLKEHHILYLYLPDEGVWIFVIVKCEYTPADGDAFLLGTQEEVPTLLLSTCGTDASKRLVVWCERQEDNKEVQMKYSDEKTEVQKATDDLAFLDGEFVENEPHDFI